MHQLLSALVYLHGRNPPIAHRDIKSDNILVQRREASGIFVKFGDFGLSRESRESGQWKTICGTWKYAAQEILEEMSHRGSGARGKKRYTTAVDIWSLGVVLAKLLCGLPPYKEEYNDEGTLWCKKIVKKVREDLGKRPNEIVQFLLTNMLIMKPESRSSAHDCYYGALRLFGAVEDISHSPTPTTKTN